jgi:hypothetical protein
MRELLPGIFVMWTARLRILFLFRLEHNDLSPRKLQRVRKELPAMGGIYGRWNLCTFEFEKKWRNRNESQGETTTSVDFSWGRNRVTTQSFPSLDLAVDDCDLARVFSKASSSYSSNARDLAGAPKWGNCRNGSGTASACGKAGKRKEVNPRHSVASIQRSNFPPNRL